MDVVKTAIGYLKRFERSPDVSLDFGTLTRDACSYPVPNLLLQTFPNEFGCNKASCGTD